MSDTMTSPLAGIEQSEKAARAIERIKERFKVTSVPESLLILAGSESGIHDLYMNLNRQLSDGKLEEKTKLLISAGVASALGSKDGVNFFTEAAIANGSSKEDVAEAIAIATTCSVFNGYYRFRHQIPADWKSAYEAFKAPFNANAFMKTTLDGTVMEAVCIAVSSVNNCEMCVAGHGAKGLQLGLTHEQIDEIIKAGAAAAAASSVMASL